jgi:hypothetical protein
VCCPLTGLALPEQQRGYEKGADLGPPRLGPEGAILDQGAVQPLANAAWKQMKSFTLSTGALVEPSQLA